VSTTSTSLGRLLIEADFLRRFELAACDRVLAASSPDYVELLVNLYEPIATNAIGRAVIGQDPRLLRITDGERAEIARLLGPAHRGRALREAADATCDALDITEKDAREYLRELAPELLPRIDVGLKEGELRGVFVG